MLIASKYEEVYPPSVQDLVFMCAKTFTQEEILRMESHILYTIDFKINSASNMC